MNNGRWKQFWNLQNFCYGRLQTIFGKSNAFSVKGACPPPGWCHAHFFHKWSSPLLVLSIDVSFVLKFFWKGDKNFNNWTSDPIYMEDPVGFTHKWHQFNFKFFDPPFSGVTSYTDNVTINKREQKIRKLRWYHLWMTPPRPTTVLAPLTAAVSIQKLSFWVLDCHIKTT